LRGSSLCLIGSYSGIGLEKLIKTPTNLNQNIRAPSKYNLLYKLSSLTTHTKRLSHTYTGHTQKNGAALIVFTIKTAPFFCVCPVYTSRAVTRQSTKLLRLFKDLCNSAQRLAISVLIYIGTFNYHRAHIACTSILLHILRNSYDSSKVVRKSKTS
jgi:hypothetical protein